MSIGLDDIARTALTMSLLGLGLASCTHDPAPPLLSFGNRACSPQPDLLHATALKLDADKPSKTTLDGMSPCITPADGGAPNQTVYSVFVLPDSPEPYLASVDSDPVGAGLFPPRLSLLDADGKSTRTIPADSANFHGASLHMGIRIHPGEHYLLVTSDPQLVGHQVTRIADSTQAFYSGGPIAVEIHSGTSAAQTLTYALDGTLTVTAMPVPKVRAP